MPNQPEQPKSDWLEQMLYRLHGYDKGEVPLLDAQITEIAAAIRSQLKERLVAHKKTYITGLTHIPSLKGLSPAQSEEAVPIKAIEKELGGK